MSDPAARPGWRARLGASAAFIAVILAVGGCCVSAPAPDKYFDLKSPFNTLNAFAYAVEIRDWDFAYRCLSSEDRTREVTPTKIWLAIDFFTDPDGVPIKDIILNSERRRERISGWDCASEDDDDDAQIHMPYEWEDAKGVPQMRTLHVQMKRESIDGSEPLWRIQFERSIHRSYAPRTMPAPNPS